MKSRQEKLEAFGRILDILDELRVKCPWDRKQTTESLRPQTVEEVYELSAAILDSNDKNIAKELGDLLLHVLFYSKIGEEQEKFDIADVINLLCDKLIYRHPHVFGAVEVADSEEVVKNWEMLKTKEKDGNKRVLSGVPESLPPLLKAYRMQDKARAVGFDWEERSQVWDKVAEEMAECRAELDELAGDGGSKVAEGAEGSVVGAEGVGAVSGADRAEVAPKPDDSAAEKAAATDKAEMELGDFLFAVVNAARLYGLNPDTALERSCAKFRRRFTYLEEHTIRAGRNLKDMSLAEMDEIWDEGKAKGL